MREIDAALLILRPAIFYGPGFTLIRTVDHQDSVSQAANLVFALDFWFTILTDGNRSPDWMLSVFQHAKYLVRVA